MPDDLSTTRDLDRADPPVEGAPGPPDADAEREAVRGPAGGAFGVVDTGRWAWRQLTSMRTALFLLMLLAVGAVPGSVLPQRGVDASKVTQYIADNPGVSPWLERVGLFDVYASPWFSAIYLLLFVSLIGCVLPRSRVHWQALRSRPPRTPARLERMPAHLRLTVDADPATVLEAAHGVLRGRRYRADLRPARTADGIAAEGRDEPGSVSAERGHLRETGNLVFHLALVGLLVAVALGSLLGYRGQTILTTGTGFANSLSQYDTFDPGTWVDPEALPPFQFTLDSLQVEFETEAGGNQFAAPRDFNADVTVVTRPGAEPQERTVRVNEPLSLSGANIYLQGNGYAPVLTVRDATGKVARSGPVVFLPQDSMYSSTGVVKVPDAAQPFALQGLFLPTWQLDPESGPVSVFPDALDPRLFFTGFVGDINPDEGVYTLDVTGMKQMTKDGAVFAAAMSPGETVDLPDGAGSVTFERLDRYAAFQVRHDPAKGWALLFAVAAMLGLVGSLFVPRRRVWVRAERGDDGRTVVEVAALARSEDPGLDRESEQVVALLKDALGEPHPGPERAEGA